MWDTKENGPRFGPSGNSELFYELGYKSTLQAPEWLHGMGLDAFEYSFGRGVRLGADTAEQIAAEAEKYKIAVSVHAPYFINLSATEEERFEKNAQYFEDSLRAARHLGAKRVVFHPGACKKMERREALDIASNNFRRIISMMDELGYGDITLCPETMGKINQLGDLDEVLALCALDERLLPTLDFGHLHARGGGCLNSEQDFLDILNKVENCIGTCRTSKVHIHFCRIEYTLKGGEKQHRRFIDTEYGPEFSLLARAIIQKRLSPIIICESKGTMAEDAKTMRETYQKEMADAYCKTTS
ncbi:TIM barrel protein [Clostridia bacterium OttesenSCG-928-F22]|nr:TIM barrel protein [Clostridia bacterium OttesenSCG-928-F22]